jgi:hypothetical protein
MQTEHSMNIDVLSARTTDGIAVITLGSAKRIYFDAEMGDALTQALEEFAGDPNIRVVIVTGGAPGYFNRHFSIPALIEFAEAVRASGRRWHTKAATHHRAGGGPHAHPYWTAAQSARRRKEGTCARNCQPQGSRSRDGDRETVLLAHAGIARLHQASCP